MISIFRFLQKLSPEDEQIMQFVKVELGIKPKNLAYYKKALTHSSVHQNSVSQNNERLEYLGDSVLSAVVAKYLFSKYPEASEGELTMYRSQLISRKHINRVAETLKVHELLRTKVSVQSGKTSIYGNTVEALFGAVFLDKGFEEVTKAIEKNVIEPFLPLDWVQEQHKSPKSKILEWCQARQLKFNYFTTEITEKNEKYFQSILQIEGQSDIVGFGNSKKQAETDAATNAEKILGSK